MRRPPLLIARRVVQTCVLALTAALPWLNAGGWHRITGNFFQFDLFGLPLSDPLATAQVTLASRSCPGEALTGALAALGLAVALGPVFCSWACPYGLVSELVHGFRRSLGRSRSLGPARPGVQPGVQIGIQPEVHTGARPGIQTQMRPRTAWRLKLCLTLAGLGAVGLFGLPPLLNLVSMPGWFSRLFQQWEPLAAVTAAVVLAGALTGELVTGTRLWCRFVCPQSVPLALVGRLLPWRLGVRFAGQRCTCPPSDRPCGLACSLGLDPRRLDSAAPECNNCGDCVGACAGRGKALGFTPGGKDARGR